MQILHITDVHHPAVSGEHYRRSGDAFAAFSTYLESGSTRPDLIAASGDLVNRGSARIDDLEACRQAFESIGIPYVVCPGNHDVAPSAKYAEMYPGMEDLEPGDLMDTNFGRVFGIDGIRSRIDAEPEGWRILAFALRDEDPDGQLDWLEESLNTDGPNLVFGHYPVLQTRNGGYCSTWGYSRIAAVRDRLASLLTESRSTVIYCCGHQHINSVVREGSCTQIETGALGNSPYCLRNLTVERDRLEVETVYLPGFDDWLTDVMNLDKSSDAEHETPESYHHGNAAEQRFTMAASANVREG